MSRRRQMVVTVLVPALVAGLLALWWRPGAGAVGPQSPVEGDAALAAAALEHLEDQRVYALTVAEVSPEGVRTAAVGAPLEGTVEIGSITKGITGLIYADMVERGEVAPETRLGEVLDLGDAEAAEVTLEELAQHRSGLPVVPPGARMTLRNLQASVLGRNPYTADLEELTEDLRAVSLGPKEPEYSNLGFAALGHALAAAVGTDYATLFRDRFTAPAGLDGLTLPATEDDLGPEALTGRDVQGRRPQPWIGRGYAPTGTGARADAATMAELAGMLLDGSVPGAAALEPQADFEDGRIGAGWFTDVFDGQEVLWHNGGTAGFRTWLGVDRERGTAVFLGAATTAQVDPAALALLREAGR